MLLWHQLSGNLPMEMSLRKGMEMWMVIVNYVGPMSML